MSVNKTRIDPRVARDRLHDLIRRTPGESCASLSRSLGRNHAYIQQYIQRGQPQFLKQDDIRRIADRLGVNAEYLTLSSASSASGFQEHDDSIVFIPMLSLADAVTSAGRPKRVPGADSIPFRALMLAQLDVSDTASLAVCHAQGDSMMPTFGSGDLLLVDMSVQQVQRDGLYLVAVASGTHEKRISVNPVTGRLTLRSDNPLYPVWPDCPPDQVTVLGRIIWQGRRL